MTEVLQVPTSAMPTTLHKGRRAISSNTGACDHRVEWAWAWPWESESSMGMEFDVERGRQESNQALEGLPSPLRLRAGVLTNGATAPPGDRGHDKREWSPRGQAGNAGISGGVACKFGLRPAGFGSKRREKYAAHFLISHPY